MGCTYKRISTCESYGEQALQSALEAVSKGTKLKKSLLVVSPGFVLAPRCV